MDSNHLDLKIYRKKTFQFFSPWHPYSHPHRYWHSWKCHNVERKWIQNQTKSYVRAMSSSTWTWPLLRVLPPQPWATTWIFIFICLSLFDTKFVIQEPTLQASVSINTTVTNSSLQTLRGFAGLNRVLLLRPILTPRILECKMCFTLL